MTNENNADEESAIAPQSQSRKARKKKPAQCHMCEEALQGEYFMLMDSDAAYCPDCQQQVMDELEHGSAGLRFMKAGFIGTLAAMLGAGIYYGVQEITGYDIGLISILIGAIVGAGVRFGAEHRGGIPYQLMAVVLTYLAIVSAQIPFILSALVEQGDVVIEDFDFENSSDQNPAAIENDTVARDSKGDGTSPANSDSATTSPSNSSQEQNSEISNEEFVYAAESIAYLAISLPFYTATESPIWILIICIGLYQAFVMNKKLLIQFRGPYNSKG